MKTHLVKNLDDIQGDVLLPVSEEMKPLAEQPIAKSLSLHNQTLFLDDFESSDSEVRTLYTGERRIILLKLGKNTNSDALIKTFRRFAKKNAPLLKNLSSIVFTSPSIDSKTLLSSALCGLKVGEYDGGLYKQNRSESKTDFDLGIYIENISEQELSEICIKAEHVAEVQMRVMDLMNTPGNRKSADTLADWANESAKKWAYEADIFDLGWIKDNGMLAIEAVNRGSETPAKFIVLRYKPENVGNCPKVGLVGKGITYDTGGLSIKPSDSMIYMKSDMGGAAAVLGTVELAARLALPIELVAAVPVTDNLVDALAIKPGDVIGSYSGKSIEVLNTDAEGRLILADALNWMAKHENPDHIIDLATLTGAAVRSLGYSAAALMGNDQTLLDSLIAAGEESGERVWPFPLWDEYFDELKSDVADLRNIGLKPIAGQIIAGKFLEQFIENHKSWAHIDIAGTAFGDTEFGRNKNATAYGVRLLLQYLENI